VSMRFRAEAGIRWRPDGLGGVIEEPWDGQPLAVDSGPTVTVVSADRDAGTIRVEPAPGPAWSDDYEFMADTDVPRMEWIPPALCDLARRSAKVRRRVRRVLGVDESVIVSPLWGHGLSLQGNHARKPRARLTRVFVGRWMTLICSGPAYNMRVTT
jgi:hypothetical protein